MRFLILLLLSSLGIPLLSLAQVRSPDKPPAADNSPEAELASFTIHPEFEVSLFADESLGIANPVAMQWDESGRLWVLCTLGYAQLKPGEAPNDKLFILEDSDGDNKADTATVFADRLEMPTGFALGHGGVYLADGPDLLHLRDTDNDDRADEREVILSGFGTGDTHQNISNFAFDSGGFLYFSQGLHAYSHVETPWGVSRGDKAGFWRFDPHTLRLDPFGFPSMTSQNPCGIAIDRNGSLFLKSNGPHLGFATPGLIPTTRFRELMQHSQIGKTPGKSMGVDIVENAHQPDWLQQNAIIAGYFARQVNALPLRESGSGFEVVEPTRLIVADHPSFRPVDIRLGPDGAIYIADWFNPVINHYQVSLRHPHRDYKHGRIWRLTAKNRPLQSGARFESKSPEDLIKNLDSSDRWTRHQARRLLFESEPARTISAAKEYIGSLSPESPPYSWMDAYGVLEAHRAVTPELLDRMQSSHSPFVRATAARIIARSFEPIPNSESRLEKLLRDEHPRPRLEAVIACANIPEKSSLRLAMLALESDVDKDIDYALHQTVHALEPVWLPALKDGDLTFSAPDHLAFVLEAHATEHSARFARQFLAKEKSDAETTIRFLTVLARFGDAEDLETVLRSEHSDAGLLQILAEDWNARRLRPSGDFQARLAELLENKDPEIRTAATSLAGFWGAKTLAEEIEQAALAESTPAELRTSSIKAFALLRGKAAAPALESLVRTGKRIDAMDALVAADVETAANVACGLISRSHTAEELSSFLSPLFKNSRGLEQFRVALIQREIGENDAKKIQGALARLGKSDRELTAFLNPILGIKSETAEYDAERVKQIVERVSAGHGRAKQGEKIYHLPQLNCVGCHQLGGAGGTIGPSLDAVGAGLPLDQIIDSVLYPARQIKEGYFATSITTVDELVHTGYLEKTEAGAIWIRDTATRKLRPVSLHQILRQDEVGSLMPPGLTASLSDQQLLDLIAYLKSLTGR